MSPNTTGMCSGGGSHFSLAKSRYSALRKWTVSGRCRHGLTSMAHTRRTLLGRDELRSLTPRRAAVSRTARGNGFLPRPLELQRLHFGREAVHDEDHLARTEATGVSRAGGEHAVVLSDRRARG